jgi:hypothetical protein
MTESEMIDESIERVRDNTRYVLEHEKSADVVLRRVSGKLMQLVGAYRLQGVCPSRRELEDCCAMILAIGIACDAKPI